MHLPISLIYFFYLPFFSLVFLTLPFPAFSPLFIILPFFFLPLTISSDSPALLIPFPSLPCFYFLFLSFLCLSFSLPYLHLSLIPSLTFHFFPSSFYPYLSLLFNHILSFPSSPFLVFPPFSLPFILPSLPYVPLSLISLMTFQSFLLSSSHYLFLLFHCYVIPSCYSFPFLSLCPPRPVLCSFLPFPSLPWSCSPFPSLPLVLFPLSLQLYNYPPSPLLCYFPSLLSLALALSSPPFLTFNSTFPYFLSHPFPSLSFLPPPLLSFSRPFLFLPFPSLSCSSSLFASLPYLSFPFPSFPLPSIPYLSSLS